MRNRSNQKMLSSTIKLLMTNSMGTSWLAWISQFADRSKKKREGVPEVMNYTELNMNGWEEKISIRRRGVSADMYHSVLSRIAYKYFTVRKWHLLIRHPFYSGVYFIYMSLEVRDPQWWQLDLSVSVMASLCDFNISGVCEFKWSCL